MSEPNVVVETARRAKSALRKAFPGTKFSVQTSGSTIYVEWSDDGLKAPSRPRGPRTRMGLDLAGVER